MAPHLQVWWFCLIPVVGQWLVAVNASAAATPDVHNIIPAPAQLQSGAGAFEFNAATQILYDPALTNGQELAEYCRAELARGTGFPLPTRAVRRPWRDGNAVIFEAAGASSELGAEGYTLVVSTQDIRIAAANAAGWFYGLQTLRQLLPVQIYSTNGASGVTWQAPAVTIKDRPRFAWRGFMLDVSRNFFDIDTLKQLVDALALHKLNILHLHLTDNDAWRLVIDKYPELTSEKVTRAWYYASYYKGTNRTFYTKDNIREIVSYAKVRQVTVMPEIDMPGHAYAANRAYPEFAAAPSAGGMGNSFNPGKAGTYVFLKDILTEVIDLFPSPYIHTGGDEVRWDESVLRVPDVQALAQQHGYKTPQEVEGYFDRQITDFIIQKGRVPCGWDDLSAFGIHRDFIAFWWTTPKALERAIRNGYRVVACPYTHMYFDYGQERGERGQPDGNSISSRWVYDWEPVPTNYLGNEAQQIIGIQANLWTPYVEGVRRLQYMIFPRLAALAEAAWVAQGGRNDYAEFSRRVDRQIARYEQMGFYYRRPVENIRIGAWSAGQDTNGPGAVTVDITPYLGESQEIGILFYLDKDDTPYDKIKTVELREDGQVLASASRVYCYSAEMFKNHLYTVELKSYRPDAKYGVRALPMPGQRFDAVIYLRPQVQPETYRGIIPWKYWPANQGNLLNVANDPPRPAGENLLRNSSFEDDLSAPYIDYWYIAYPENAALDEQVAKDGGRSICLKPIRYDCGITYKYVTNLEPGRKYTFSIWARAEKPDSLLLASVAPESREPPGLGKIFRIGVGWQRLAWTFAVPVEVKTIRNRNRFTVGLMNPEFYYPEWEAGNLKSNRSPYRQEGSDQIGVSPKNGRIWLDAAQLERGGTATSYKPSTYPRDYQSRH